MDKLERMIAANLARVEEQLAAACARAGRSRQDVTLMAVTKTRSLAEVHAACACGLRDLGENRIEELASRIEALQDEFADDPPRWHMIGHIQSRKALDVVAEADVAHSVDSLRLAERLNRFAGEAERILPVYIEFNVSGEPNKYGFPGSTDELLAQSMQSLQALAEMPHLQVLGLMTMAPFVANAEQARPVFVRLRELACLLKEQLPFAAWDQLSMGMTNDYQVAIEEGATIVRIGRAIFGPDEHGRDR